MCREHKSCHIIRAKLSRGKLYHHLAKAFATIQNERPGGKSFIAEKLSQSLDFTLPMDFNSFVDNIDTMINKDPQKLMKLAFSIFDFNGDGFIDEIDIYCVMKLCDFQ
jgi:Ca2+-binding EF-hand superfamily protein